MNLTSGFSFPTLNVMHTPFNLEEKAGKTELWTRDLAKGLRNELNQLLSNAGVGGIVIIDAKNIKVFDYSFGNEFFGKTVLSISTEFPGRIIAVDNLDEYTEENLNETLKSLGIAMLSRKDGEVSVIGKLHNVLVETFFLIHKSANPLTANNIKDSMNITVTAANERLTKLIELGMLRREKEVSDSGREIYVYSTI